MNKAGKKRVIGVTGGVASGKSTVAAEFARHGCAVIDADAIAHEALDKEDIKAKLVQSFGGGILDGTGTIERSKLAAVVFADADKLRMLNSIVHPYVLARAESLIRQYNRQKGVRAIVLDMPLLVEVGWDKRCDRLVFVDCNRRLRADRSKKMGVYGENELAARENFQISLDSKAELADITVDNNSGLAELSRQVAEVFSSMVDSE